MCIFPVQPQLPCRNKLPKPNEAPNDAKDDTNGGQDSEAISSHTATALARVEKRVRIETLGGMSDVSETKIAC